MENNLHKYGLILEQIIDASPDKETLRRLIKTLTNMLNKMETK